MLGRVIIENVHPRTPDRYPAKGSIGERVEVNADAFRDGHDLLAARVRWRPLAEKAWRVASGISAWEGNTGSCSSVTRGSRQARTTRPAVVKALM